MFQSAHVVDYYVEKVHTCNDANFSLWFNLLARAKSENYVGTGVDESIYEGE